MDKLPKLGSAPHREGLEPNVKPGPISMSPEAKGLEPKQLLRKAFEEVFEKRNPNAADHYFAKNFELHSRMLDVPPGLEAAKQWWATLLRAFPDLRLTFEELFGEGEKVVARAVLTGTNDGEFLTIKATHRPVRFTETYVAWIENGKITQLWAEADLHGLLVQLGHTTRLAPARQEM